MTDFKIGDKVRAKVGGHDYKWALQIGKPLYVRGFSNSQIHLTTINPYGEYQAGYSYSNRSASEWEVVGTWDEAEKTPEDEMALALYKWRQILGVH